MIGAIRTHWDELRLATSIKQGTVTVSLCGESSVAIRVKMALPLPYVN